MLNVYKVIHREKRINVIETGKSLLYLTDVVALDDDDYKETNGNKRGTSEESCYVCLTLDESLENYVEAQNYGLGSHGTDDDDQ